MLSQRHVLIVAACAAIALLFFLLNLGDRSEIVLLPSTSESAAFEVHTPLPSTVDAGLCLPVARRSNGSSSATAHVSGQRRCFPSFVIVGSMKAGTGALMASLQRRGGTGAGAGEDGQCVRFAAGSGSKVADEVRSRPHALGALAALAGGSLRAGAASIPTPRLLPANEVHFFGLSHDLSRHSGGGGGMGGGSRAALAYLSHFPAVSTPYDPPVLFDKSPDLLRSPAKIAQLLALLPSVRLVALVRDSVGRQYSQFQHHCRHGRFVAVPRLRHRTPNCTHASDPGGTGTSTNATGGPPHLHSLLLRHLHCGLGWAEAAYADLGAEAPTPSSVHLTEGQRLAYPCSARQFHSYVTGGALEDGSVVRRLAAYRDVEELAVGMVDALGAVGAARRKREREAVRREVLAQWRRLWPPTPLPALSPPPLFEADLSLAPASRRRLLLMLGPQMDLAAGDVGQQLTDVARLLAAAGRPVSPALRVATAGGGADLARAFCAAWAANSSLGAVEVLSRELKRARPEPTAAGLQRNLLEFLGREGRGCAEDEPTAAEGKRRARPTHDPLLPATQTFLEKLYRPQLQLLADLFRRHYCH